jgi:cobalt-zinc-cadmium efflux system outer membrane protein
LVPNPTIAYTREDAGGTKDDFFLVQQALPVTGRLGLLRRAGQAAVNATQAESSYALLQLRSDLRLAFYDLLLAQEREAVLRRGVVELEEVVRILRLREQEGEGSAFDRLRAERELADIGAELGATEVLRAQAQSRLASFFAPGTEASSLTAKAEFSSRGPLPPLAQLVARALAARSDYKAGEWQMERLRFERDAAQRKRIPEPVLTAGSKTVRALGIVSRGYVVTLTVPIPLFNRGQTEAARARADYRRVQAERDALRQRIETKVTAAHAAARIRRRIADDYVRELGEKGVELARIAQIAYREGEQGILELLDAYRVSLLSQLRALELSASAKQAEIELDRAAGEEVLP